jgi:hypothetical protein
MRKLIIALAAAGSALAFATPAAAAQYYPAPYGAPYGNAYGYNNYGQIRSLQVRVDQLQRQINLLDRRNVLSNGEARRLRDDARDLERRLHRDVRDGRGLSGNEIYGIQQRIARLEQRIYREANDGRRYGNYGNYGYAYDRDRDGRDDRYEDDRGYRHDR